MEQETPTTRDLAILVLSYEKTRNPEINGLNDAIQLTFDKLNGHLSIRLGSGGYYTLLQRAVKLATLDLPSLASIHVSHDGVLEGFQDMADSLDASDGCLAILSRLIELLDTFIGRNLTLRILHNAWPDVVGIDTVDG